MSSLPSGCPPLDSLLDGGLEPDAATMVFGEPGSGKTNFALQCAREAARRGGRVAFIDTEGVSSARLAQVYGAVDTSRLLFFHPYSIAEQERMVRKATLLQDLGLVVVDSVNMHYRLHLDQEDGERDAGRSLYAQLHHLTGFARRHDVPVLVTGQVYGTEDATQPFARRVMEHLVKAVVRFDKRPDGSRRATLLKHRSIPEGYQALFRIGGHGLEPTAPEAAPEGHTDEKGQREAGRQDGGGAPDVGGAADRGADGAPIRDGEDSPLLARDEGDGNGAHPSKDPAANGGPGPVQGFQVAHALHEGAARKKAGPGRGPPARGSR